MEGARVAKRRLEMKRRGRRGRRLLLSCNHNDVTITHALQLGVVGAILGLLLSTQHLGTQPTLACISSIGHE